MMKQKEDTVFNIHEKRTLDKQKCVFEQLFVCIITIDDSTKIYLLSQQIICQRLQIIVLSRSWKRASIALVIYFPLPLMRDNPT